MGQAGYDGAAEAVDATSVAAEGIGPDVAGLTEVAVELGVVSEGGVVAALGSQLVKCEGFVGGRYFDHWDVVTGVFVAHATGPL